MILLIVSHWAEENNSPVSMLSHFSSFRLFATLRTPSLPGSFVHGSLQARTLEWAAFLTPGESSWPRDRNCVSYVSFIGRRVFTTSAAWEAQINSPTPPYLIVLGSIASSQLLFTAFQALSQSLVDYYHFFLYVNIRFFQKKNYNLKCITFSEDLSCPWVIQICSTKNEQPFFLNKLCFI